MRYLFEDRLEAPLWRSGLLSSAASFLVASGGVTVPSIVLLEDDHVSSVPSSACFLSSCSLSFRLFAKSIFSVQCQIVNTSSIARSTMLYVNTKLRENRTASTSFRNPGSLPGSLGSVRPGSDDEPAVATANLRASSAHSEG